MNSALDLRQFLDARPCDPDDNARLAPGTNGRVILWVHQPMGLEHSEVDGQPDGRRRRGRESALEFPWQRLAAAKRADAEGAFMPTAAECAEWFDEGTLHYQRFVNWFRLKDCVRAERDTTRNLRLIDFVKCHAEHAEDRAQLEQWRPAIARMNASAMTYFARQPCCDANSHCVTRKFTPHSPTCHVHRLLPSLVNKPQL